MTELMKIQAGNVCARFFQSEPRIVTTDSNTVRTIHPVQLTGSKDMFCSPRRSTNPAAKYISVQWLPD